MQSVEHLCSTISTRFQLTVCSHGSSALAEPLFTAWLLRWYQRPWTTLYSSAIIISHSLGRPTLLSADLHFTEILLSFFFFLPPPNLQARWTELNQNWPHARKQLWFENACPKSGVSPSPLQIGGPKTVFWADFTTRYGQSVKCVDNYKGSPTSSQNVLNFGPQTASSWTAILPTLCKFCFLRHCQALQMEISKQNSTKLCQTGPRQTADGKSR